MARKFLEKYFPPIKFAKMRNDIMSFTQAEGESFYEAWDRYKELLAGCPHHGIPLYMQVQTFYNGLMMSTEIMVDATVGGSLNNKTPEQSWELFEVMANDNYQRPSERTQKRGVLKVDTTTALLAQMQALSIENIAIQKQLYMLNNTSPASVLHCDFCHGNHLNGECTIAPSSDE